MFYLIMDLKTLHKICLNTFWNVFSLKRNQSLRTSPVGALERDTQL